MFVLMYNLMCALVIGMDGSADVISRYESNLEQIHTLRGTFHSRISLDGGKTWINESLTDVRRSGNIERIHETRYGSLDQGKWKPKISHKDHLYTSSETRIVTGLDPASLPRVPLSDEASVRLGASIQSPSRFGVHGYPSVWTFMQMLVPDARFSLRELRLVSSPMPSDSGDKQLLFKSPDGSTEYEIEFSAEHHGAISRKRVKAPGPLNGDGKPIQALFVVEAFLNVDPGISIPRRVRISSPSNPGFLRVTDAISLSVNQPIADKDLALDFLAGTVVSDQAHDHIVHIWGEGGPRSTFYNHDDYMAWESKRRFQISRVMRHALPWGWISVAIVSFALLVILLKLRKTRFIRAAA